MKAMMDLDVEKVNIELAGAVLAAGALAKR
jgi:hypothetical protein